MQLLGLYLFLALREGQTVFQLDRLTDCRVPAALVVVGDELPVIAHPVVHDMDVRVPGVGMSGHDVLRIGDSHALHILSGQPDHHFVSQLRSVVHGFDTDTHDIVLLHERLRTLSGELMLLFDSDNVYHNDTLPCLKLFQQKARYDPGFDIRPHELSQHIDRVGHMRKVVERVCMQRIELYRSRITTE